MEKELQERLPEFMKEAFTYRIGSLFPQLSSDTRACVVNVLLTQANKATALSKKAFLEAVRQCGIDVNVPFTVFTNILFDVGCAIVGLGIDILETDGEDIEWSTAE